ncbi:helix-turn-helix domain-containing protein [Sphaerisporangium aureirubrum]|uniref:Helix-turn-helix domain-containing protein n=1 Tax=Sphaerisporangium aureirubrum TaxID=1544736 RepID=A0ABW1NUC5_9ACTN
MPGANPTLRRRQLAGRLRELRKHAGLSIEDAAQRLECSTAKISRIETGQRGVIPRDVRDLCQIYGLGPAETDALMTMAREAREGGWWQAYDHRDFRLYLGLEAEASAVTVYDTCAVPGILQTEEYAGAIIRGVLPGIREEVLRERVDARMKRQRLLHGESPPHHLALLDESVLHRHIGNRNIMRAQLDRLLELARLPQVTIQIVPFSAGAHIGFNSAFALLEMADSRVSDVVYTESMVRMEYFEKPAELALYREAIGHLRAAALDPPTSEAWMAEVNQKYAI